MQSMTRMLSVLSAFLLLAAILGCGQEGPAERAGKQVDQAADNVLEAGQHMIDKAKGLGQTLEQSAGKTADQAKDAAK